MKPQRIIPAVPGVAIALLAAALGFAIANGTIRGAVARHGQTSNYAVVLLAVFGIGALTLAVFGLVILKSHADRGYQRDRDLLGSC